MNVSRLVPFFAFALATLLLGCGEADESKSVPNAPKVDPSTLKGARLSDRPRSPMERHQATTGK